MATITTDDVQHVATLARLEFKEEDIEQFTHQLARILGLYRKIERTGYDRRAANVTSPNSPQCCQSGCRQVLIRQRGCFGGGTEHGGGIL